MKNIIDNAKSRSQKKAKLNPLDQSDQIYILKNFQDTLLNNIVLRGVKNINKVILRKIKDNLVENAGAYVKKDIWVLDTIGTNMLDVLGLDYIDPNRTYSNDIIEIFHVLGMEAARFALYNELAEVLEFDGGTSAEAKKTVYGSLSWIAYPMLAEGQKVNATDVRIRLRVNKEYKNFVGSGENGGKPMYGWSMNDISTKTASQDQLTDALKLINVVPNPYYAFSDYERTRIDTRVKITNLPERCTVRIYSVNGKLVRTFKKDSEVTSLDWDLNNSKGIPVGGGVYLIHVEVPGAGEVILKFFGGMRSVDLQGI